MSLNDFSRISAAIVIAAVLFISNACVQNKKDVKTVYQLVNPLIGTAEATTPNAASEGTSGHGQTFPAVGEPFAMTSWTPQTRNTGKVIF